MGLCKPVMGAREVTCAWASVSQFLPHNSATLQSQVLMSMQMDAHLKKEQIGTLFVRVGAPGVLGRGGGGGGPSPKSAHAFLQKLFSSLLSPL